MRRTELDGGYTGAKWAQRRCRMEFQEHLHPNRDECMASHPSRTMKVVTESLDSNQSSGFCNFSNSSFIASSPLLSSLRKRLFSGLCFGTHVSAKSLAAFSSASTCALFPCR